MKNRIMTTSLLIFALSLLAACATTPTELESARATLDHAKTQDAHVYAPVAYENAEHALKHAESTFADEGTDIESRADAYVAHRKALTAIAIAERVQTEREAEDKVEALMANLDDALDNQGVVTRPAPRRIMVSLNGAVLFKYDTSQLMELSKRKLDRVAMALIAKPGYAITVEGHTDAMGTASYNTQLSEERAAAVRSYLIKRGVSANRIDVNARGESDPVASNATPEGRANNRRVEIVLDRDPFLAR